MSKPSLCARSLTKSFGKRVVVNEVDIEVAPGRIVGLLGPNGAGKTTTFQMILGLVPPDAGNVHYGIALDGLPIHRRARMGLGYLPQGPSVLRGLDVRNNLLAILEHIGRGDLRKRADELLDQMGLAHLARQKAKDLSGGERRRLEFARALLSEPEILLCDEPFSGVDPIAAKEIGEIIVDLSNRGMGILLTDHNVRNALHICHVVYLMVDGRILETGTPKEIMESEEARRLYLGADL